MSKNNVPKSSGFSVIVRGSVVAWFAEWNEAAEDWCRDNHFGEWLTWRSTAPEIIPLTPTEYAECQRKTTEIFDAIHKEPRIAD